MFDITSIIIGLCGGLGGIFATKVIERFWISADKNVDAAKNLRDELWAEVNNLRKMISLSDKRIDELEKQCTEWRERYFEMLEKYNQMEVEYRFTCGKYDELEAEMECMRESFQR